VTIDIDSAYLDQVCVADISNVYQNKYFQFCSLETGKGSLFCSFVVGQGNGASSRERFVSGREKYCVSLQGQAISLP
jgi:hypothetical protein